MKKLGLLDKAFLLTESRQTPMHVGGLSVFNLPRQVNEQEFLHELAAGLSNAQELQHPFGGKLKTSLLGLAGPAYWENDTALDMGYHIRHSALPAPGRYRELFTLVSRLHSTLLDRTRPLWEMHLIEGLQNRQFAVYAKYHHAVVDGARAIHLAQSMLSKSPRARVHDSPLSIEAGNRYRERLQHDTQGYTDTELRNVADFLKAQFDTSVQLFGALKKFTGAWIKRSGPLMMPFMEVPQSSINTQVDGARRFVAQSWPFERVRAIGRVFDGTFNDAVLAVCAGTLRLYLANHAQVPEKSLKAMVPISLRREGDLDASNAVGFLSADLATNIADAGERFSAIQASAHAGKQFFHDLSANEAQLVSILLQVPAMLLLPLGLMSRLPPYNTVISNVPGPRQPMYWNGARLAGMYPASVVTEGIALNITMVTYNKNIDFGFMACRRSLPQAQRLIDYMEQAIVELEQAAGIVE
ncbi:MAG: wax ester/triacylglycerol synthase family O-acyltransferase [Gammaproteobacteria bacterium]|nr:wax ester/triacylglycerol synthase family O-acyltransferase [Gammaproteobacteria bacterium]NND39624.1 wax ester/triacylglycerol synthase family O-acyltransferase [Pseudomonadales bacterium]RZV51889.1 MAG: wax ester/triacylglycerol synthase family O-acyltransferase [Pseudomonadales bacterium]